MTTREQFEKTVRAMRAEGVPVSIPNLMIRTELPRATIEDWLEDMDKPRARPAAARGDKKPDARASGGDAPRSLMDEVNSIRDELLKKAATRAVKEKLGISDDDEVHGLRKHPTKDLRWAAVAGLFGGPLGLCYAAPWVVAAVASVLYLAAVLVLWFVPLFGAAVLLYALPPVHLVSAVTSAAYAWRYNRTGQRSALLPRNWLKDR